MKKNSTIRTLQEKLDELHHIKETQAVPKPKGIPGVDIPGFGGHFQPLALQGPMGRKAKTWHHPGNGHPDPHSMNRGGALWFHTKRRGGQVGRQRDRRLPLPPIPD